MRVLYLYRSDRSAVHDDAESGVGPDTALYGLRQMPAFGHVGEFFDEDRRPGPFGRACQALAAPIVRETGLGWNIGQALRAVRRLRAYDCVFATTDSTGLPLSWLKRLGWWRGSLVVASQGLAQALAERGWNWALHLHRWSLAAADLVVAYGWQERRDLVERFGIPDNRALWIPFGVDAGFYALASVPRHDHQKGVVLSVGRDRGRDYDLLLCAARLAPEIPFRIITTCGRLGSVALPRNVEVLYDLPIQEVARQYAACRFVVLPVRESSYSFGTTTALDAMAMGKAVVVSRTQAVGPAGEGYQLMDGEHCRFVPVGDAQALSLAIHELWDAPDECLELGRRAQTQVRQRYSSWNLAERLAATFEQARASSQAVAQREWRRPPQRGGKALA